MFSSRLSVAKGGLRPAVSSASRSVGDVAFLPNVPGGRGAVTSSTAVRTVDNHLSTIQIPGAGVAGTS